MLNIILVILGVLMFVYSLYTHIRFLGLVKKTPLRNWWLMLLVLVLFFALGYIAFAFWLAGGVEIININFLKTLVSFVFFFGAIFVVITISLIYSTVKKISQIQTEKIEALQNKEKQLQQTAVELKRAEEKFRQVAETAGEWIWEVNKEGIYTYASPVVETILGYKPEEIVEKKHFYDFFAPEVKEDLKKGAFEFFEKKTAFKNFINPNMRKNGNVVLLETSGFPVLDEKGNLLGYRGIDKDVTENEKSEEELKNRSKELERINKLMVGRELKMMELKKEMAVLRGKDPKGRKY